MPAGRPSDYTPELAELICELLSEMPLVEVCEQPGMPSRGTVRRWQDKDPEFDAKCARARAAQSDMLDKQHKDTITKVERGQMEPEAARVVLNAVQWRAMKIDPKRYGDKLQVDAKVETSTVDALEMARRRALASDTGADQS
jgi:hypothetical protein